MTKIEWTHREGTKGETWNPIVGCSIVSPGCTNCYAMGQAGRIQRMTPGSHYEGTTKAVNGHDVWTGTMKLAPESIVRKPLHWTKPRTIFVNSMSDLFHDMVPDEWIDRVFATMALTPQHTYQVLTKRPARMRRYFDDAGEVSRQWFIAANAGRLVEDGDTALDVISTGPWPLPNVWLGVSAERQQEADARIPDLLNTPAAVRFVSAEPLLGPIDFTKISIACATGGSMRLNSLNGRVRDLSDIEPRQDGERANALDWIIVGGESGAGARPMHPDWARSIRDQCEATGTAFFFKQWGAWRETYDRDRDDPDWRKCDFEAAATPDGQWLNIEGGQGFHGERVVRVMPTSKARAGRLLDGREWNGMPTAEREVAA